MILCKELGKSFATKKELFKALKARKEDIIAMKKAAIKYSDPCGLAISGKTEASKGLQPKNIISYGDYVYPVINTTKIMDSHLDVHLNGIWDRSVDHQQGKTYLLINHELAVGKVISQPKDVEIMIKDMSWSDLGQAYEGTTQALIFKSKLTERSNKDGFLAYKEGDPVQHSIRMQYVKIDLAINTDDDDFENEKATWDEVFPQIVNKEDAEQYGYFWGIREAKIHKEGSMVLVGSNEATPTLYDLELGKATSNKIDPPDGTQFNVSEAIQKLNIKL